MKILLIAVTSIALLLCSPNPLVWAQDTSAGDHVSLLPSDLMWIPVPSLAPGAEMAVIEGDLKSTVPFTFRLKLPPNFKIGVHTHPVKERVTVLSGVFHLGIGDKFEPAKAKAYPPGAIAMMPSGMRMFAYTSKEETILQVHGTGPWGIDFLDPADDPRAK